MCLVAKNEERNIRRCLNSIKYIADEIILVDTGSSDNTIEVAKEYGAKIFTATFNNDFSEIRNISLEKATKEWILYIDCDEEIDKRNVSNLKKILEATNCEGFSLKLINVIEGDFLEGPYLLRIIKNGQGYKFSGKIHEQIISSIYEKDKNAKIFELPINLFHFGYDLSYEELNKKNKRNLDILLSYKDEEKDGFYYFNLGNQFFTTGDYIKAQEVYEKSLENEDNEVGFMVYIPPLLLQCYYENKKYKEGLEKSERLLLEYPNYRDIYFLRGALFSALREWKKARESYISYKNLNGNNKEYPDRNYEQFNDIDYLIDSLK